MAVTRRLINFFCLWILVLVLCSSDSMKDRLNIVHANICDANKTLTFLQVTSLTGWFGPYGTQYAKGLQAAFTEYNQAPSLGAKALLNLVVKNDGYDPTFALRAVTTAFNTMDIFAVVGMYSTTSALATFQTVVDNKVPFIGAPTGVMALREPFQRYVVNFRASIFDEAAAMVEHLVARHFRCIAVFWQDDEVGEAGLNGINAALDAKSMEVCAQGKHTKLAYSSLLEKEMTAFIKSMTSSSIIPDAIMLVTVDKPASAFIVRARALWPGIFVGGLSYANPDLLIPSLNRTNPSLLNNLVFPQLTPLLTETSVPLVRRYKSALTAIDPVAVPSSVGIEGYLVGRLVTAALDRTNGNFTRQAFLDAFYETGFFNLDAVRCGPLLPSGVDGGCNQCMHQVAFVEPQSDGTLQYVDANPFFRFSSCGYKPYEWTRLVFAQSCSYLGVQGQTCRDFRDGIYAAFKQVNDDGGVRGSMKLQLVTNDDLDDPDIALQNNIEFLEDPTVFGLIGTSPHMVEQVMQEALARNKPMFGAYTGIDALRDPFHRSVINFRAHQGDELSAIVHHCYYKTNVRRFSVLYENSSLGIDGKIEFEDHLSDKRLKLHSEGMYNYGESNLTEAIYSIFFGPQGLPEAVVVIGFDDILDEILLEAHALNRNIYVFALSQVVTTELLGILNSPDATEYLQTVDLTKLIFVQTVPVATDLSIPAVANYTAALASFNTKLSGSAAGLEGYLVGRLVATTVQRVMGTTINARTVVDAIYDSGSFNLFGTNCGPFLDSSNVSEGCNQCMKRVWLTSLSDDGRTFRLVDDSFSFTMCLYKPSPNLDFQLRGMRLVMVIIASVGNAFTIVVIAGLASYRHHERIRSSFKFSVISCMGALLSYSSVYLMYFIPTDLTCALEPWIADMSFVMLFGPLFSKTQRIDKIFNNKKMKKMRISDEHVLMNFLALLVVFMSHLVVWATVSPRRMEEAWTPAGVRFETCTSPIKTFQYLSWILKALVLLWGCFLCVRVYKISGQFGRLNESREIAISIYNTTLTASVALVLIFTLTDANVYFVSFTGLLIVNTTVVVGAVFVRPLHAAIRRLSMVENDRFPSTGSSGSERNVVVPMASGPGRTSFSGTKGFMPVARAESQSNSIGKALMPLPRAGSQSSSIGKVSTPSKH